MDLKPAGNPPPAASLADRLREVQVGVRADLEVSRHVFHGQASYIVRDPITFQTHQLGVGDYEILVRLKPDQTLGEVFEQLVEEKTLAPQDQEAFYNFVVSLHRLAFLNLPISDDKAIYRRFEARQAARRWELAMGAMFLRIPLLNPNAFLSRTIGQLRFIFTRWFFAGWVALMAVCVVIAGLRWQDLTEPLNGVLAGQNLLALWVLFVVLKVIHEFGHAYACRHFGGHVPEMGVFLILLTPCAYVDASAAWGFSSKRERMIVSLAGMYAESFVAALALLVWSVTDTSAINSLAYQTFFLAGFVTLAFNLNPLMRYDGYYIFSDLLELPNLRSRAQKHVLSVLKRVSLGLPASRTDDDRSTQTTLLLYGIAAAAYRVLMVLGICGLIASKLFLAGLFLATAYLGRLAYKVCRNSFDYLWKGQETAHVRTRAKAVAVSLMVVAPLAVILLPLPNKVETRGVVGAESEHIVRAGTPGFVQRVVAELGQVVSSGDVLVELANPDREWALAEARAQFEMAQLQTRAYETQDYAKSSQESQLLWLQRQKLHVQEAEAAKLWVAAEHDGLVTQCLRPTDEQRFVQVGEPVATICSGRWIVRALLTEDEYAVVEPKVGQAVQCRGAAPSSPVFEGEVVEVVPSASHVIEQLPLTHLGGGQIPVDPATGRAKQPYFEVAIALKKADHQSLRVGMAAYARFDAAMQPIGLRVYRRVLRFTSRLMTG